MQGLACQQQGRNGRAQRGHTERPDLALIDLMARQAHQSSYGTLPRWIYLLSQPIYRRTWSTIVAPTRSPPNKLPRLCPLPA